jgi:peptide-methionine (S)-S-oxide reductase
MDKPENKLEIATLGGGCFWCTEAIFSRLKGVEDVIPGYAGGSVTNPNYEQVCTDTTGHAEVVQIKFDPEIISYDELLRVFFTIHDPTTLNRQGADVGSQYRSIILYHNDEQRKGAEKVMKEIEDSKVWGKPLVTELTPFKAFYPAEEYHKNYFEKNPYQPYCQFVIAPKVAKLRQHYLDRLKMAPE